MRISSIKSFFSVAKPIGEPVVTKCGTTITKWNKGADTFKKVVYGEGNEAAKKIGLKEYVLKIAKDGKKNFEVLIQNSKGETVKTASPFNLGMCHRNDYSADQTFAYIKLMNMFNI